MHAEADTFCSFSKVEGLDVTLFKDGLLRVAIHLVSGVWLYQSNNNGSLPHIKRLVDRGKRRV